MQATSEEMVSDPIIFTIISIIYFSRGWSALKNENLLDAAEREGFTFL